MQLQPNESLILSSDNNTLVLTNLRVHGDFRDWGYSCKVYIFLEDISSIQMIYRSFVALLTLAVCAAAYGGWAMTQYDMGPESTTGFGLALLFLALWWLTRRRVIAIYSNGGRALEVSTSRLKDYRADELVEEIQLAKTERLNQLYAVRESELRDRA